MSLRGSWVEDRQACLRDDLVNKTSKAVRDVGAKEAGTRTLAEGSGNHDPRRAPCFQVNLVLVSTHDRCSIFVQAGYAEPQALTLRDRVLPADRTHES